MVVRLKDLNKEEKKSGLVRLSDIRENQTKEGERYASQMRSVPELLNPFKVQENIKNQLKTKPAPPQNRTQISSESSPTRLPRPDEVLKSPLFNNVEADKRQQDALNSPITKLSNKIQEKGREWTKPLSDLFPKPKSNDTVGLRIGKDVMNYRSNVQEAQANNPVGAFIGGAGDAATLGLTSYVERMLGNPEVAERITQSGPGKAGQIAGQIVLPAGKIKAGASLVSNIGRGALAGAGLGVGIETGEHLTGRNNQSLGERVLDVGISGALGGAGAGIVDGIGKGLQMTRGVAQDVVGRKLNTANAIETANRSVPTERLRVQNNTERLSKMMGDIKPVVNERMTPPLENPRELAKWLQPHLGDVSLNDVNRLPYEDMRQLATEVQRSMNVPDMARRVANDQGQDLDSLLNQTAPTFKQTTERLRMGGISGAIEAPQNVKVAIRPGEPLDTSQGEIIRKNWLNSLFGDQSVGITPIGSRKSNKMVSTEQQIVNNPLINSVKGTVDQTKQAARAVYQNNVDYLSPLKTINRQTYDTAMDASRANNLANTLIRDKFVDNQGNVIGSSLNDIMKNTRGLGNKVDDYLVLRHAITRMERGERVYDDALKMTPDKARQAIKTLESRYPELKRVGGDWDGFNTNILDNAVKEGLISKVARDAMREQNPNYASMRRQFSTAEKFAQPKWGGGASFSGQSAPIKSVSPTGSTRKIISPIRSAIEQSYAWKNAELRNRTMQEIVSAIQADPQGMKDIAQLVKKPSTSYRSLDDALREGGSEEFLELLDNDFRSLFAKNASGDQNIVRAMVNGNPVYVKVEDPEAVKALLGLGNEQSGIALKTMQFLSDATKRGATGLLAPMFAIKSLTADTVQAAIQSPNAFKHMAVDLPHAAISSIAEVLRIPGLKNLAEDFKRSGGEYSALLRGDRRLNTSVMDLRREAPLSTRGIAKGALLAVKSPFKALEKAADMSENINRMAAFNRAIKGKERTPENVRNAINAARESTVNFSRKGSYSRETEAFAPYSNAAVQGMYRLTKAFYKNPVKTIAGLSTLVIAPKLYEYAMFNEDADYQKLPARERYRNIIISKNKDGTFNKQFMPPEYLAFGSFITDVLNDVVHNDPDAYKGTLDAVVNAFTPPLVSGLMQGATQGGGIEKSLTGLANASVAGPAVATISNQSFSGSPIVPQRLKNNSSKLQYDERTSSVAKQIGKVLNFSPMKVDYLLRAYGGDPARLLLPLTSDVGGGTTRNTLLKNFIVDPTFTNTLADDYYKAKDALLKARADNSMGEELPSWYSEDNYKLANSTAKGAPAKRLSDLNAEKREINRDRSLSAKDKVQKIREIQTQINEIYVDVNSKLRDAGVPMKSR
ncbi:LPD38 domain-containing protein [Paenibacillus sp. L3-i20]|uniref:LPD38 domain-containing protein n=1 Tax=Paenibacillus sp. L3-i20 TaxID=2905833 RepID=UPI001EE0368E|nr:LPD38 domain-containing protein [Paenibacillus sp. L3-i20]GKU76837.1 hypothetical protein L3i20_v212340 [Paenibacillus sp. L3-i20]